ncbi:MAG: hypothetical protein LBK73_05335 [Treponema sp.]|nr:hypothetical protein [Treponema sp.]
MARFKMIKSADGGRINIRQRILAHFPRFPLAAQSLTVIPPPPPQSATGKRQAFFQGDNYSQISQNRAMRFRRDSSLRDAPSKNRASAHISSSSAHMRIAYAMRGAFFSALSPGHQTQVSSLHTLCGYSLSPGSLVYLKSIGGFKYENVL